MSELESDLNQAKKDHMEVKKWLSQEKEARNGLEKQLIQLDQENNSLKDQIQLLKDNFEKRILEKMNLLISGIHDVTIESVPDESILIDDSHDVREEPTDDNQNDNQDENEELFLKDEVHDEFVVQENDELSEFHETPRDQVKSDDFLVEEFSPSPLSPPHKKSREFF
ncbi:hypothetical protein GEMRC1_001347 [Eukaryota sp. GEM-RC1]